MKNNNNKEEDVADYLVESAEKCGGISCATVSDGHVLVFTKSMLENLIKKIDDKKSDKIVIFIKRPDVLAPESMN